MSSNYFLNCLSCILSYIQANQVNRVDGEKKDSFVTKKQGYNSTVATPTDFPAQSSVLLLSQKITPVKIFLISNL